MVSMFQKVIFNWIAEFVRWLIIWKVPLLSLNSTLKLNFEKALENKHESTRWWQISS